MISLQCAKEKISLKNIFKILIYKIRFAQEHPDYFHADGLVCFCGPQGSGKTLSAVNYVYNLLERYPHCILVTNLMLKDYPIKEYRTYLEENAESVLALKSKMEDDEIHKFMWQSYVRNNRVFPFNDNDDLQRYQNDERGVIFLIDEIQLYMNSLQSKNINMDTMTQISQQRKQRKHIVCTSQVFGRMAKPLREQFSVVIACKCFFSCIQWNRMIDRDDIEESTSGTELSGTCKKKFLWMHHPDMYKRYDTYYVIQKGKFVSGEERKGDIYGLSVDRLPNNC